MTNDGGGESKCLDLCLARQLNAGILWAMKTLEELPIKSGGVVEAADQFDWQPLMEVWNDRLSSTEGS